MALCSPFAALAASPLAAAFPAAPCAAGGTNAAAADNSNSSSTKALMSRVSAGAAYCCSVAGAPATAGAGTSPAAPALAPQCYSLPAGGCMDFDALLAAAARKPGYHCAEPLPLGAQHSAGFLRAGDPCIARHGSSSASAAAAVGGCAGGAGSTALAVAPPLLPGVAAVLQQYEARGIADGGDAGIADAALGLIRQHSLGDTFYVYDLGEVCLCLAGWLDVAECGQQAPVHPDTPSRSTLIHHTAARPPAATIHRPTDHAPARDVGDHPAACGTLLRGQVQPRAEPGGGAGSAGHRL
jgi:hypothetical protein